MSAPHVESGGHHEKKGEVGGPLGIIEIGANREFILAAGALAHQFLGSTFTRMFGVEKGGGGGGGHGGGHSKGHH